MHVIYIVGQPLSIRNCERFGVSTWLKNKHTVEVWFLEAMTEKHYFMELEKKGLLGEAPEGITYKIIRSPVQMIMTLFSNLKRSKPKIGLDILMINLAGTSLLVTLLTVTMRMYGVITMNVSINEIPENKEFSTIAKTRFKKYLRDIPSLIRAFTTSICVKITSSPEISVVSGFSSLIKVNKRSNMIYAFSTDYDHYLKYRHEEDREQQDYTNKKYIVFLDQDLTRNVGFTRSEGFKCLEHSKYIKSMTSLFKLIENMYECEVIIAMHPRANLKLTATDFFDFRVISSNTLDLVKRSLGVITVGSSSVSFAILHSKPILFITSDEMEESGYINHNAAPISMALELSPVNIDRIGKNSRKEIREKMQTGNYKDYFDKYLCSEYANTNLRLWQLIMQDTEKYIEKNQRHGLVK